MKGAKFNLGQIVYCYEDMRYARVRVVSFHQGNYWYALSFSAGESANVCLSWKESTLRKLTRKERKG